MRGGFLERLTRIDLGTPDRQVGVDRVGPGAARRRQLRGGGRRRNTVGYPVL
jgi:hypothetical protein